MSGKIVIIGGGPAGMMAAISAAEAGAKTQLWERNKALGRKLSITGKGRCNLTNFSPVSELVKNFAAHGSFLYGAFSRFDAEAAMDFFQQGCQVPLKVERGQRVFPVSDRAADVVAALEKRLLRAGVEVCSQRRARKLALEQGTVRGVYEYSGALHQAEAVIIATGGLSYPATGCTGDGYALAEQAGHTLIPCRPSLVPLETIETWPARLSGLALKNVELRLVKEGATLDRGFGEMLFTHFGVSGPLILSLSHRACQESGQGRGLKLLIDLKPALDRDQLDARLVRDMEKHARRQFANSLSELLPASLIPVMVELSSIPADKPVHQISRPERQRLASLLKELPLTVSGPRPLAEALVTAGGVDVREVDPRTMASRLVSGLFFAGEVLDIVGYTGGFNLQAAWSSGRLAGLAAAESCGAF